MIPGAFTGHALHTDRGACPVNHDPRRIHRTRLAYRPQGVSAPRSLRRDRAQGRLTGDIYPRVDPELPQDVGDMGRDGSPGQQQLGGDLRVGQTLSYERGDLGLGRRQAVPATPGPAVFRMRAAANAMSAEPGL